MNFYVAYFIAKFYNSLKIIDLNIFFVNLI